MILSLPRADQSVELSWNQMLGAVYRLVSRNNEDVEKFETPRINRPLENEKKNNTQTQRELNKILVGVGVGVDKVEAAEL